MTSCRAVMAAVAAAAVFAPAPLCADEVLEWNAVLRRTLAPLAGAPAFRLAAIVQVSVFDALNGIERRYTPIRVTARAPSGASRRAAVAQAAYTALVGILPAQTAVFDADLAASLGRIASDAAVENSRSIALGRAWGERVAREILAWRSGDGFDPNPSSYIGSTDVGKWRPTPPAFAPGAYPSLAHTLPWVIPSTSSFRPPGPPALTSSVYTADFNEVKEVGAAASTVRTPDQSTAVRFWAAAPMNFWHRAAADTASARHTTLSENARLFALLTMAGADAIISCWEAKYLYSQWRPITGIRLAATDGNPATVEQADWTPFLPTPPYPDYSSGHASVAGASQAVLTAFFGSNVPVRTWSEAFGEAQTRSYPSFSAAADEANLSRIWAGIHWRHAVVDARRAADALGGWVVTHAAQPLHGEHTGQLRD